MSEQLRTDAQAIQADNKAVPTLETFARYVSDRAQKQADWHRIKVAEHVRQAKTLRMWQLFATGLGVVLSTAAGLQPAWHLTTWTAAATTIAAALGAHIAATGHQRIAASYAGTSDQLDRLIAGLHPENATPDQRARFVADVELVLAAQNHGWTGSPQLLFSNFSGAAAGGRIVHSVTARGLRTASKPAPLPGTGGGNHFHVLLT